ncbi:MAG: PD40 domain-containing protein, partial [Polyangiaceae bacterium]|nr:PD40 domain-containing protein [Polyangiaceae bacterium]
TIRTEHFDVNYHAPLDSAASRAALLLEEIHASLVPVMGNAPDRRVQVLLTDGSESANGSATALPYDAIRLFVTAPDDLSVLGDYDDWLSLLITHEHTHVLHLDNIGGIPSIVNAVVGKIWAPNHLIPRFVTEGMAVYIESARTSAGRLRSTQFEMYMRMATLEERLLRLDELSHGIDEWPFGNAFYLYGSRFIEWVVAQHGEGVLAELATFYGRRAVPYGVSRAFKRATGKTLEELYAGFCGAMRREHRAVRARVDALREGRVEGERITHHGLSAQYPRFLDESTIVYRASDGRSDNQLRTIRLDGSRPRELSRVSGSTHPSPHPDGSLYADMLDEVRDIYVFYDLFRLDLRARGRESRRIQADRLGWERLTYGMRARAPDVSPDGRRIVFTSNGAGTTHLMVADTADVQRSARPLLRSDRFDQVFTPRFSPDGRFIAVSTWERGGYRDVSIIDVETGERRSITSDRAMDTGPTFSPDGAYVYFSSDRTGIANLFRYRLEDGALEQVTNVLGGAYMPVVSPDGSRVVYVGYTSIGFDLYSLDLDAHRAWPAPEYIDDRPRPRSDTAVSPLAASRYRPARTLYPRSVSFDLSDDGFGQNLGVSVVGEDIAGFYAWSARLGLSLVNAQPQADARFSIRRLATPVSLTFFRRASPRRLTLDDVFYDWTESAIGGSASIRYDLPDTFHHQSLNASYSVTHIGKTEPFGIVLDPNAPPPVLPLTGLFAGATIGYSFSDVRRHSFDISPSEGRSFGMSLSAADPVLGSQYRIAAMTWSFTRYYELFPHHVLAMRYAGGISGGEVDRRRVFFLGGFPDVSIIDGFVDNIVLGGQALRGYAPSSDSGTRYQLYQLEYRLPIYRPQVGYATLPLFLRRIHGSAFFDVGDAYDHRFDARELRVAVGAELFVDFTTWYFLEWKLRVGFAQGLMDGGGSRFYAHLGVPF